MSNGSLFEILLYAALAAFVLFRLRSVLGKRTGHEERHDPFADEHAANDQDGPARDDDRDDGNVISLPGNDRGPQAASADTATDEELMQSADTLPAGITRIKLADSSFDEVEFLRGGRAAFEMIVQAFASGDRDGLKPLLTPDLHRSFVTAIYEREKERETQETTIVTIRSSDIVEASLIGSMAKVTVEFITDQVKVTRDVDGAVVDGDPDRIETFTDLWTFERDISAKDPNWALVATNVPDEA
jgi:predicted lipid-binding transport protein (Tim44 family)